MRAPAGCAQVDAGGTKKRREYRWTGVRAGCGMRVREIVIGTVYGRVQAPVYELGERGNCTVPGSEGVRC